MNTQTTPTPELVALPRTDCRRCDGDGWVFLDLGQCGDYECCGGPVKGKCPECTNEWNEELDI